MKKTVLVVGALGSLCAQDASAQTNVTLYGLVDVPIEYVNRIAVGPPTVVNGTLVAQPGGSRVGMLSSGGLAGSRFGLRGTEDLGGGYKALFVLENGFALDTGAIQGGMFGRQAYMGISNNYGALTFGRQYTSIYTALSNFVPLRYAPAYEPSAVMLGTNVRSDNMVVYNGSFGPFNVAAHYSFGTGTSTIGTTPLVNAGAGESPGNPRDNTAYGAGFYYLDDSFGATVAYDEWNPAISAGNRGKVRKLAGALSYEKQKWKVMAGYRWESMAYSDSTSFGRDDLWWAGAIYQASPALELNLGYYYLNAKSVRITPTANTINPVNPWQVSFLMNYSLSKRTQIYLTTAYARHAGLNLDTPLDGFRTGYFPAAGQNSMFGLSLGFKHKF